MSADLAVSDKQIDVPPTMLTIASFVRAAWKNRYLVAAILVVAAVGSLSVAYLSTPEYRATATIISASTGKSGLGSSLGAALGAVGSLSSLAGIDIGSSDVLSEEALAVLQSRDFSEAFIARHGLITGLFLDKWDDHKKQWREGNPEGPSLWKAYERFDRKVRLISQDKKTGLISVQVSWRDRSQAAELANDLVMEVNSELRMRALARASASLDYLEAELLKTSDVETRAAIYRLLETQLRQKMLANVTEEYAFRFVNHALVPDVDDPSWPRKSLVVGFGMLLGVIASLFLVSVLLLTGRPTD